jgi:hypothetical protein
VGLPYPDPPYHYGFSRYSPLVDTKGPFRITHDDIFSLLATGSPAGPTPRDLEAVLLRMHAEHVKRVVREIVMTMAWPEHVAPLLAQREAQLKLLDEEIVELEAKEAALVNEARAAGIRLGRG